MQRQWSEEEVDICAELKVSICVPCYLTSNIYLCLVIQYLLPTHFKSTSKDLTLALFPYFAAVNLFWLNVE